MAAAERRQRQRRAAEGFPSSAPTHGAPQLRDPLGIQPPWRRPQPDTSYSSDDGDDAVVDPVEQVWDSLSARHQCFIDRWPPTELTGDVVGDGDGEEACGPSREVRQ